MFSPSPEVQLVPASVTPIHKTKKKWLQKSVSLVSIETPTKMKMEGEDEDEGGPS